MPLIRTSRLLLRPAAEQDLAPLNAVYGNADAMKYWDTLPHASMDQTKELLDRLTIKGDDTRYLVVEHEGIAIGTAGFWRDSEVGFIIHPDHWGKGLARELLEALLVFGFDECGFSFVVAETDPDNDASNGLLTSFGFKETGRAKNTLQIGDNWFDSIYYRLDEADF